MEGIRDEDRRRRLRNLEERIRDPRSVTNIDCLLDTVQALASDCDHPSVRRMKNVEAYMNRCKNIICYLLIMKILLFKQIHILIFIFLLSFFFSKDDSVARDICKMRMRTDDFTLIKVIGRGAFGEVQLVRHKSTQKVFAMKLLSKFEMVSLFIIHFYHLYISFF